MKILIDMNLTPVWEDVFRKQGFHAVHWSSIGAPTASDREIMDYAKANGYVVFTHDLDFGNILAVTGATGPSVIQVRTDNPHFSPRNLVVGKASRKWWRKRT